MISYPLGALLARAHAQYVADCESRLADAGFPDLTISHGTNILRHLTPGTPARLTDLVPLSNVTKQAISQQTAHLVAHGYLTVSRDERDRRGRIVLLTDRGVEGRRAVSRTFVEVHEAWEATYGEKQMHDLFETLAVITDFETAF